MKNGYLVKTSSQDEYFMNRIATRLPIIPCKKINPVLIQNSRNVSSPTVARCLRFQFYLKSFEPTRKPRVTAAMKSKRLKFAKQETWTAGNWYDLIFS